jgi:hypothetical protein
VERVRWDWLDVVAACVAVLSMGIIYTVAVGFIDSGTAPVRTSSVQQVMR